MMQMVWTFDRCAEEALKYSTRMRFKVGCSGAYWSANKHRWLDKICTHMELKTNPKGYWTIEKCRADAAKYKTKRDYRKGSYLSYEAAKNHDWLSEICSHMIKLGNRYHKCVYTYEFPDGFVYVGLTYSIDNRQARRNNTPTDQVTRHIRETGLSPVRKQLTGYIPVDEAIRFEGCYVEKYRADGWNILNAVKTGSIGGNVVKWTYKVCKNLAAKYKSRRRFKLDYGGAYSAAYTKGWIDDICSHMRMVYKPIGFWTYEKCKKEASMYGSRRQFKLNCQYAYKIALKSKWLDEFYVKCSKAA